MAKKIVPKTDDDTATAPKKTRRTRAAVDAKATPADSLLAKFPNLMQAASDAEARLAVKAEEATDSQLALPFWPEQFRALPNEIFRSALFNARNKRQPRIRMKSHEIYVIGTAKITYTGEELRQDDETVWLQLIQLAKSQPAGNPIQFTALSFLKAIQWPTNTPSYERLRDCLTRMQATSLQVISERLGDDSGKGISMIPEFEWKNPTTNKPMRYYTVRIARPLVRLFGGKGHFTRVEWAQRLDLPAGLATWLHGYLASHAKPHPIKLETIREGAALTSVRLAHVRELVEKALDELKRVKFLKSWAIMGPDKDLVVVERASSTSPELEFAE
ncbi:plasmid replication initiator TrfA [Paraburkholderia kururiensis]|uniref:Plasmid replication initiator TrfA n=1 Tax=Paraburkholderia kururiensis TaxID=984307 RepID=A0ABZ0WV03_9BURK|nr:plasmid replication initiator TrfA [Paraburkholderia kururiensis]WQD81254.1 plasmid replication initiator TrfA [Paraburkholderia kururiensis]